MTLLYFAQFRFSVRKFNMTFTPVTTGSSFLVQKLVIRCTHLSDTIWPKPLASTLFITSFCLRTIMSSGHISQVCSWNGVCIVPAWPNTEKENTTLTLWLGSECQCAVRKHSTWKLIKSEFPSRMFTCFPTHDSSALRPLAHFSSSNSDTAVIYSVLDMYA